MVVEIYDKVSGNLLYETKLSRYWDYFDPKLKAGSYLAKIYPVEKAQGMDSCTYYNLTVDSNYHFKKMFSLKSVK